MTGLHDPAFGVRRVLWLAYGVLAVALIFFIAAIVMLRDHHAPGITQQPPAAASPSAGPALTQNPPTGATGGSGDQARAQNDGASRSWTGTGFAPGEPPGDIEDEPRGGSGSGTASLNPPTSSGGGAVPALPVPNPALPSLPTSVVPHAAASVIPSVLPSALPSPPPF